MTYTYSTGDSVSVIQGDYFPIHRESRFNVIITDADAGPVAVHNDLVLAENRNVDMPSTLQALSAVCVGLYVASTRVFNGERSCFGLDSTQTACKIHPAELYRSLSDIVMYRDIRSILSHVRTLSDWSYRRGINPNKSNATFGAWLVGFKSPTKEMVEDYESRESSSRSNGRAVRAKKTKAKHPDTESKEPS